MVINNDNIFAGLIIAFIAIIIGVSLFASIADTIGTLTGTFSVENRTFTASNNTAVSFNVSTEVPTSITEVRNNDSVVLSSPANFSSDTTAGTINMSIAYAADHGVSTQAGWEVDFDFQTTDFIADSSARSITNLINIFFALAIMAAAFIAVKFDIFDGLSKRK